MYSLINTVLIGASLVSSAICAPVIQADGFPSPDTAQLLTIAKTGLGSLSNGGAPPAGALDAEGIKNFQLIQLNENFEVAFFKSVLDNVTNWVEGYQWRTERDFVINTLKTVVAQEELHALTAAGALKSQGVDPIDCYDWSFPTTNIQDALNLATTFGPVVLGTLQDVVQIFADGFQRSGKTQSQFSRAISSVIGQEGEQLGFYRVLQSRLPSEAPFMTTGIRDFAFTVLNGFIKGACAAAEKIDLKIYGALTILTPNIEKKTQNLRFQLDTASLAKSKGITVVDPAKVNADYDWSQVSLTWINQQNKPFSVKLQNVSKQGSVVSFDANFPFDENLMFGLSIAAVTFGPGPFKSAQAVADAAIFGPAFVTF